MKYVHESARQRKRKTATRRRKRGSFAFLPTRRCEITRHALHVGAVHTDDLYRWCLAWCWNNPRAQNLRWSLWNWSKYSLHRELTETELDEILDDIENRRTRRCLTADNLARWLGLTFADRTLLNIKTIGAIDVPKRARKKLRKKKDSAYQAARRRDRGARPQAESLSQTQPWKELGMSRRSWYRRNKLRTGTVGTTSSAALLSDVHADESVPRTYENLSDDLRILALGLLSHTESAWSELERAA